MSGNKKILVTGADGFIGSHLVEKLLEQNYEVRAFVLYNSFNSWGWLDTLSPKVKKNLDVYSGDIRDMNSIRNALKGISEVYHLAALIAIPYSYYSPESYVQTNITGTLNVLLACKDLGIERVLVTSTSEVYGTAQYVPIDEMHPRQGQSPYSATKIGADAIAESFYRSFNLPVTIVRPFNTYGPRQSARAVIPTVITQLLNGKKEIKLGSLHPTRDLLFAEDTADAFVQIAKSKSTIGQEINIATQQEISIGDLVKKIMKISKTDAKIISEDIRKRPQKSEVERLLGSAEKLKKLTGWKPKYTLEEGLEKTICWFSDSLNMNKYKPDIYNV